MRSLLAALAGLSVLASACDDCEIETGVPTRPDEASEDCMNWDAFAYMSDNVTCNAIWEDWDNYCWSFTWDEEPDACVEVWNEMVA